MNQLASALISAANSQSPYLLEPYTKLKQAIAASLGAHNPISQAVAQLEAEPYVKGFEWQVESAVLASGAALDPTLNTLAQELLQALPPENANSTTFHPAEKAGLIICDSCGSEQRDNRLLCFFCGKTFVSAEEWQAAQHDPLGTQRLTLSGSTAVTTAAKTKTAAAAVPTNDSGAALQIVTQRLDQQTALLQRLVANQNQVQPVVVQDLRMDFASMIVFMVKWSIAAIPAVFILMIVMTILMAMFGGVLAGLLR